MSIPTTQAIAELAQKLTGINPVGIGDLASPPTSNTPGTFCTTAANNSFTIYLKDGSGVTIVSSVSAGGVVSFNTRSGAVTLTAGDINALAAGSIQVAKIADPGANKLIGDTNGGTTTGSVTVGTGLTLSSGTLSANGFPLGTGITYVNGWADAGAGYEILQTSISGNVVTLAGVITGAGASSNTVAVLPSNVRPTGTIVLYGVAVNSTAAILRVELDADGTLFCSSRDLVSIACSYLIGS